MDQSCFPLIFRLQSGVLNPTVLPGGLFVSQWLSWRALELILRLPGLILKPLGLTLEPLGLTLGVSWEHLGASGPRFAVYGK